eukprot:m.63330 g.63330  ORF g.63330 m.63330 type:complete len:118 (+) comp35166_c0_seq3:22-375(+)
MDLVSVLDYERYAEVHLPSLYWRFFSEGAIGSQTVKRNQSGFERCGWKSNGRMRGNHSQPFAGCDSVLEFYETFRDSKRRRQSKARKLHFQYALLPQQVTALRIRMESWLLLKPPLA